MRLFEQTFQRANIKVAFTQGYNPKPRLEFVNPVSMGITGDREIVLVDLVMDSPEGLLDCVPRLNACAPEGFEFLDMKVFETDKRLTLSKHLAGSKYRVSDIQDPTIAHRLQHMSPGDYREKGYEIVVEDSNTWGITVRGESNMVKLLFGPESDRFSILAGMNVVRTGLFIEDAEGVRSDFFALQL